MAEPNTENEPIDTPGKRVKAVREILKWSQPDLARLAGLPNHTQITKLETGHNKGTGTELHSKLALAFGVSLNEVAAMMAGRMTPEKFVAAMSDRSLRDAPSKPVRWEEPDDNYENRAKAVRFAEQAIQKLRSVAHSGGDKPVEWWLMKFSQLMQAQAESEARIDAIVSDNDDTFDVKPNIGPTRGKK